VDGKIEPTKRCITCISTLRSTVLYVPLMGQLGGGVRGTLAIITLPTVLQYISAAVTQRTDTYGTIGYWVVVTN
jgi:hypothetical protein